MKSKRISLVLAVMLIIGVLAAGAAGYFLPVEEETAFNLTEPEVEEETAYSVTEQQEVEEETNPQPLADDGVEDNDSRQLMLIDFQGAVTVGTALINLEDHPEDHLEFEVSLNTHSVDLDQYDLAEISRLSLDGNIHPIEKIEWKVTEGEGHHLKGRLTLMSRELDTAILEVSESVELEILGLGGADTRLFRWELPELLSAIEGEGVDHDS